MQKAEQEEDSPYASVFKKHNLKNPVILAQDALHPCYQLPVGCMFEVDLSHDFDTLRQIIKEDHSDNKKAIVVVQKEDCYEICRVEDRTNVEFFYKDRKVKTTNVSETKNKKVFVNEEKLLSLCGLIKESLQADDEMLATYDRMQVKAKQQRCVTHTYLSRRVMSRYCFKVDPEGPTAAMKEAIDSLMQCGALVKLTLEQTQNLFESRAAFYGVNPDLLPTP